MRILFILFVIAHCPAVFSQTNMQTELDFQFYDPNIRLYAIGENHVEDNADLHLSIIRYIQQNADVNVLILEFPVEMCKIINEYVLNGRKKEEMDALLNLYNRRARRNYILIVDYIREYNLSVSNEKKIRIAGIDRITLDFFYLQAKALDVIFPELENSDLPLVKNYITHPKKKYASRKKDESIVDTLIKDASKNAILYKAYLKDRFPIYVEQLYQIKADYTHSWRKEDSIRELFMFSNLDTIIDSYKVSILICGGAHTLKKEKDTYYYGYAFTSILAVADYKYPNQTFSLVTQHYDKKLFRFFDEFNLLSNPNALYFEDRTKRYEVLTKEELKQHPKADERCDMVIVQNTRWKKKDR